MGLDFSDLSNNSHTIPVEQKLTEILEKSLDLSRFFTLGVYSGQTPSLLRLNSQFTRSKLRVLSARNSEAFSFIYQEVIDQFEFVSFFNPEKEVPDFSGIDMLYLPGGYPEKHLQALVSNEACRKAIRQFAEQGGRIVAECGGMMYLCKSIITDSGEYPMCNVLPYSITARTADRKLSLGYRRFMLDGKEYRGHEFHYTQFANEVPTSDCQVFNAKGEPVPTPDKQNYTHLYQFPYK